MMISPVPPKARKEFYICIFGCRALTGNMALFSRSIRPDRAFKTLIEAINRMCGLLFVFTFMPLLPGVILVIAIGNIANIDTKEATVRIL
ncbi:hypothetical protein WP3S18C02_19500 [Klebsiella quasipneumoniae]|nr:hypothetical protein WP3S18C02_19500 [Klebsiella quasipneumoniae]